MRINRRKFDEMATAIILSALYDYEHPLNVFTTTYEDFLKRKEMSINAYRNDTMLQTRVRSIVAMLAQNIDDCIEDV